MRIAFIDTSGMSYDADTPYKEPLGGSASALCYLTPELVQLGHDVHVFRGEDAAFSRGVKFWPKNDALQPGILDTFDAVVVQSVAIALRLRTEGGVNAPLLLWTQHASDQPSIQALAQEQERDAWNGFVFVSHAQRIAYESAFQVPYERSVVIHNGIAPPFEEAASGRVGWFHMAKPPVLFYTSTPYRGLDVLLGAFSAIRQATGATLRVFSGMAVYQQPDEQFQGLYNLARFIDGVTYEGPVSQTRLAQEMATGGALAYPCTFPETFCVAAAEAMAAGLTVFTTDLGALREVTGGLASMIKPHGDKAKLAREFADMVVAELLAEKADPAAAQAERAHRINFARNRYLYHRLAKEWVGVLQNVALKAA